MADVETLVREHLPIVGYVVHEVAVRLPGHVNRDDLTSAGMAGLAQAATSYDPSTGVPFGRYANTRIKGAVLDELRAADWSSRGARARSRELSSTTDRLTTLLGRTPTPAELGEALGVDSAELERRRADSERAVLSMDAFDSSIADALPDAAPDPSERLVTAERVGYLHAALAALPERLRTVAVGVYLEQRPMAEMAAELGVTESRVSQLRAEALALLREAMSSLGVGEADGAASRTSASAPDERPTGVVARRKEAFYAQVAAQAASAGLGAAGAALRQARITAAHAQSQELLQQQLQATRRTSAPITRSA